MNNACFYFQVHQPFRIRKYNVFDVGNNSSYFDEVKNREVMEKIAKKCYLPANKIMLKSINRYGERFKVAYSITGTALEQFEMYAPEVLESFQNLVDTGSVELLGETYYHSLSFVFDRQEFTDQVSMHRKAMKKYFGVVPKVFRNTELIYNNDLAGAVKELGFKSVLAEGADHVLGWRSPNYVYSCKGMPLLLKNYKLSDDIAFRFSDKNWKEYPVTAPKFADWVAPIEGDSVNLFMDYETFGEHQWEDTGIFKFLEHLPYEMFKRKVGFHWPSEASRIAPKSELDVPFYVSWADVERDLTAWTGNKIQTSAAGYLYALKNAVLDSGNPKAIDSWRKLTTSDHLYYMCTKWFSDGDVHKYFNPHNSPYECFMSFMSVLNDLKLRLNDVEKEWIKV